MYAELCYATYMKTCTNCKITSELGNFKNNKRAKDGKDSWCKKCSSQLRNKNLAAYRKTERVRELRKKYNMSLEDYESMKQAQNECCKICGEHESNVRQKRLFVDHDHTTGKVRALLCDKCNKGLGHFCDSAKNLENAVEYLKRHRS